MSVSALNLALAALKGIGTLPKLDEQFSTTQAGGFLHMLMDTGKKAKEKVHAQEVAAIKSTQGLIDTIDMVEATKAAELSVLEFKKVWDKAIIVYDEVMKMGV